MRVLIVGLPSPSIGWGGEDQISYFLAREFRDLGFNTTVTTEIEYGASLRSFSPDIVIALNSLVRAPQVPTTGVFWHFNERATIDEIQALGWKQIFTNSRQVQAQYSFPFMMLGCDCQTHTRIIVDSAPKGTVGYIGNWHRAKDRESIDRYLVPLAEAGMLKLWGTQTWQDHPILHKSYLGPLDPTNWPRIQSYARVWINWRSTGQKKLQSLNCRVFGYLAAGVKVISDLPIEPEVEDCVTWLSDTEWIPQIIEIAQSGLHHSAEAQSHRALTQHSYRTRVEFLIDRLKLSTGR